MKLMLRYNCQLWYYRVKTVKFRDQRDITSTVAMGFKQFPFS